MKDDICAPLESTDINQVKRAVRMLWSEDDGVRELGRDEILRIGKLAVDPLIDLLSDLMEDHSPRFVDGREEEGRRALNVCTGFEKRTGQSIHESNELNIVQRLAINSRLADDAVLLLGELRATEAVPVLVRIMEDSRLEGTWAAGVEMVALARIGVAAIPALIQSFKDAEVRAATEMEFVFGFEIDLGTESAEDIASIPDEGDSTTDDPEFEEQVKEFALTIKGKALWVLEEIGDEQALPFLESLLNNETDERLIRKIHGAVRTIKREFRVGGEITDAGLFRKVQRKRDAKPSMPPEARRDK